MHLDSDKLPASRAAAAGCWLAGWVGGRSTASTHPLVGHADDPGVAAHHQENEAEQGHVPSARNKSRNLRIKEVEGYLGSKRWSSQHIEWHILP